MRSQLQRIVAEPPASLNTASRLSLNEHAYAPHVLLEARGVQFSTLDLFGQHYVLLLGAEGEAWRAPALRVANQFGIELVVRRIGGDYHDVCGEWAAAYGVSCSGAVLVRPDGGTAWRAPTLVPCPEPLFARVLMWCARVNVSSIQLTHSAF